MKPGEADNNGDDASAKNRLQFVPSHLDEGEEALGGGYGNEV